MGWGAGAGLRIVVALASALALAGCATPGSPGGEPVPGPTSTAPTSTAPSSTAPTSTAEPVLRRPLVPVSARELLEYCPAVDAEHFDADTAAVLDIYVCSTSDILSTDGEAGAGGDRSTGDSGTAALPDVQRASRVSAGGAELLTAYSVANAPATSGACIQLAADPLIVWLNTAAGITPVYAPVDECGFPTPDATEAFNGIELETILDIRADPAI